MDTGTRKCEASNVGIVSTGSTYGNNGRIMNGEQGRICKEEVTAHSEVQSQFSPEDTEETTKRFSQDSNQEQKVAEHYLCTTNVLNTTPPPQYPH